LHAAAVRVPCSTSNLGAGFDCIGLALERWLDARYLPDDGPLRIERGGTLRSIQADTDDDILVHAFRAGLRARGVETATGLIHATSDIPIARGLGSSGAATVAGLVLAAAALGQALDREAELQRAYELEHHPDNAAPSLYGGLVAVARGDDMLRPLSLPLADELTFVFAAPDVEVSTRRAREALPDQVPHAVAARGLGRVAALVQGFASGDPVLLRIGFEDELHVPYRLPLIPLAQEAMDAGREAGAFAVTISGSGSGLIAVTARDRSHAVAEAMARAFGGGVAFTSDADRRGVVSLDQ
jgi:homoserine kinase